MKLKQSKKYIIMTVVLAGCGVLDKNKTTDVVLVETNETVLSERLSSFDQELDLYEVPSTSLFLATRKKVDKDFVLKLVGELKPPTVDGTLLQATDVFLTGHKALVAYNVAGSVQKGAVDFIDVKSPAKPHLKSQLSFKDRDVNAISYKSGYVYITGASEKDAPAYLSRVKSKPNGFTTEVDDIELPGYAGTDIYISSNDKVLVTTGDNSGLHVVNRKNFNVESTIDIFDARAVSQKKKSSIWVLSGQPGTLHQIDKGVISGKYEVGGASIAESKSTLTVGSKWSLSAIGDGGFVVTCNKNGEEILKVAAPRVGGLDAEKTVTNAVIAEGGYLFAANGEAGVYAYKINKSNLNAVSCQDIQIDLIGVIDFGEKLSANDLFFKKGFLFVADGLGGLKIISFTRTKQIDHDHDVEDFDYDDD